MFAMQVTEDQISKTDSEIVSSRGMVETPLKVFINPKIKTVGTEELVEREGCCSMNGYSAEVSRHKEVFVSGYNENGEYVNWHCKNWNARIVQHEMDHLNGTIYIDKVKSLDTLEFNYWKLVNMKQGELRLPFGGTSVAGWKQYIYPILVMIPVVPLLLPIANYYV